MSSARNDSGQSADGGFNRQMVAPRNGIDGGHGQPPPAGGGYDQRRPWAPSEYGSNGGMWPKQLSQSNGDYVNYYSSLYAVSSPYGGWATGGGNSGFYHPCHPPPVSSPLNNAYVDNMPLFENGGNGPAPGDHPGYYYNYFPSSNGGDYNTWGGPNFVAPPRTSGSTKNAEFYHNSGYVSGGGYSRDGSVAPHLLEQNMSRMAIYDNPSATGGESGPPSSGSYQNRSPLGVSSGETKKKSWATIASRPAKPSSAGGLLALGRGRGRGVPIGGVPGSTKTDHYMASRGVGVGSPVVPDSGGFWAAPSPPNQKTVYTHRNTITSTSLSTGAEDNKSPRSGDMVRDTSGSEATGLNSADRGNADYTYPANNDRTLYAKRRDPDLLNGTELDSDARHKGMATEMAKTIGGSFADFSEDSSTKLSFDDYNPKEFTLPSKGARYFVIKSYSEDDVHRSIKYGIWCSTDHGNKRLDSAYREREGKGPIYLCFSVNASGHFCGVALMTSPLDYEKDCRVWAQDKWKGQFSVKWIYVKDVPNQQLRHIRLENNENKPVTNSRDTQEVPAQKGREVLKIIHDYVHTTSLFDDFAHYEKRQEEESARKGKRGNHE